LHNTILTVQQLFLLASQVDSLLWAFQVPLVFLVLLDSLLVTHLPLGSIHLLDDRSYKTALLF
jgi:hypothetical protein